MAAGESPAPPLVVLLRFCGEGDNTPEAIEVAQAVNDSLKLLPGRGGGGEGQGTSSSGGVCSMSWLRRSLSEDLEAEARRTLRGDGEV